MRRAFSLVELLLCIALMAIVAGILTPVLGRAKHAAYVESSVSNLHQMSIALLLYQSSYGGGGNYGNLSAMNLPPGEVVLRTRLGLPLKVWQSPCGQNPAWEEKPVVIQYEYFPETGLDDFSENAPVYQENLTMFTDMNCAEHGEPLYSNFVPHKGLGVLLSGTLLDLTKAGDSRRQSWWSDPASSSDY